MLVREAVIEVFYQLLKRCSTASQVKQLHAHLIIFPPPQPPLPPPPSLLHGFVRTYNATGCLTHAILLFDRSPPPPSNSNVLWNVLIRSFSKSNPKATVNYSKHSILLFCRMLLFSRPDNYTFTFSIAASSNLKSISTGESLHCLATKFGCGSDRDLFVGNSLISFYSVFSRMPEARKMFEEMPVRDVVSWTSTIDGYARSGDLFSANTLFEEMPVRRNDVSWAVVISGNIGAGMYEDGLKLFHRMLRTDTATRPNEAIIVSVLSSCSHMGALEQGKWIHAYVEKNSMNGPWSSNVSTALIDMYSKCGEIECAKQVFENATKPRDVWTWTSMISGFAMHGDGEAALGHFRYMVDVEGVKPDSVTFVAVLNGCSHSGLVRSGRWIFHNMSSIWRVAPEMEHYGCLIDLLGRAGELNRALETIMSDMPLSPDIVIWRSLLSSCRIHGDVPLAERVVREMSKFDEGRILLSNLYASVDYWEGVRSVRNSRSGTKKDPGCSWIEVKGQVHKFVASETLHPRIADVRTKLGEILRRAGDEGGYIANTKNVLFDLCEEEKEQAVGLHSEKLALAFGLMCSEEEDFGGVVRIMKNLRICEDCHSLMKSASLVFDRTIVVRDRSRFHSFVHGQCSCKDRW
ncbi:Pentatricopeptide repeat-containing protein [Zostera marina]|uniref:Pentatricopeptide repeat-containing protein n=1 Tax=Zostera marina TaxID=29655 RepID=A0A0K9NR58_ZOSMR|nr:Pentatricopeptide repeat-containing protein [Zostera marina]